MYRLVITKEAYKDLEDVISYISGTLKNPIAADNFLKEFEEKCEIVSSNPEAYAYCNDTRLMNAGYRKIVIKNYIVFYRINRPEKEVYIMRIIYGRRDYIDLI
ncbi:MAG: type II toxin-antitoxin system RelE/ParE family toxin [Clostridia bacterium]|nr:type II toxin-antitoxin system RelE/ParE family toxin [Clostridia bacterium]